MEKKYFVLIYNEPSYKTPGYFLASKTAFLTGIYKSLENLYVNAKQIYNIEPEEISKDIPIRDFEKLIEKSIYANVELIFRVKDFEG